MKTIKKACERFQNLSKKEKEKKQQYDREHYKNLSEDEKLKLVEYRKRILQNKKKRFIRITRNYFNLENFASFSGKLQKCFDFQAL